MSDMTHDLLVRGIAAAKSNSIDEARLYLEWVLRSPDADLEQLQEASRILSDISDNPKDKRSYLEQVLAYDPMDPQARRDLAILNGELKPEDVVDPDRTPVPAAPATPQPAQARRFVCANCGGKMAFAADGNTLVCTYCGRRQSVLSAMDDGAMVAEQDFTVALATAKGQAKPVAMQALKCQGCGASFILPPQTLSTACPYCASAYVVEQTETRELIPPEGVIPFAVTQDQAQRAVLDWYRSQGFKVLSVKALPGGVYLPVWTFDVGGEITWNCLVERDETWEPREGSEVVYENDLLIAASHTLSGELTAELGDFPRDSIVPYDARFLADWPAETYQISVSDASLAARSRVLAKMRPQVEAGITESFKSLQLSALKMVIESYKLILVPLWIARYRYDKVWHNVAVNGRTATVRGEKPRQGVRRLLSSWMDSQ